MKRRVGVGIAASVVALSAAVGCSSWNEQRGVGDAPVGKHDDTAAETINFSDRFLNVQTKCNHGHRIYSHTREGAPVVVPNDPTCPQEVAS